MPQGSYVLLHCVRLKCQDSPEGGTLYPLCSCQDMHDALGTLGNCNLSISTVQREL